MPITWPDEIDKILIGDHVVMLAYVTPARGVVLLPLTNFSLRDRASGTISSINSSVGAPRKLERIRRNDQVALAFHTRAHATTDRPEYVLVQGRATLSEPIADYPSTILANWERIEPWGDLGSLWKHWLRVYALRVEITVEVERIVSWPDLVCRGELTIDGAPLPARDPESQREPAGGTAPRLNHAQAGRRIARLPDTLLGWVGADGFPMVVPVEPDGTEPRGIVLTTSAQTRPGGARRAGLTAHWFSEGVVGQHQRKYTGWMDVEPGTGRIVYAPHTESSYRFPASRTVFQIVAGGATRWGLRQSRRRRAPGAA